MRDTMPPLLVHVMGPSGIGKTTVITQLIPLLRARRLRVGTVKHTHHGFAMDQPGKDSWQHAQAGAEAVAIIGPDGAAWVMRTEQEMPLQEVLSHIAGIVDVIIIEGFKQTTLEGIQIALDGSHTIHIEEWVKMICAQCAGVAP